MDRAFIFPGSFVRLNVFVHYTFYHSLVKLCFVCVAFVSSDEIFLAGEQLHLLVCLSAPKQNTEVITPFRVAAVMCKNGIREQNLEHQAEVMATVSISSTEKVVSSGIDQDTTSQNVEDSGETASARDKIDTNQDVSASETLLRMEDHKKQTETLLERFKNSHFFVRIAESDEPLWSKRCGTESSPNSEAVGGNFRSGGGIGKVSGGNSNLNAVVDIGDFDANASGGMARSSVRCCSLHNGDIVVCFRKPVAT